jgi:hypothetical protein
VTTATQARSRAGADTTVVNTRTGTTSSGGMFTEEALVPTTANPHGMHVLEALKDPRLEAALQRTAQRLAEVTVRKQMELLRGSVDDLRNQLVLEVLERAKSPAGWYVDTNRKDPFGGILNLVAPQATVAIIAGNLGAKEGHVKTARRIAGAVKEHRELTGENPDEETMARFRNEARGGDGDDISPRDFHAVERDIRSTLYPVSTDEPRRDSEAVRSPDPLGHTIASPSAFAAGKNEGLTVKILKFLDDTSTTHRSEETVAKSMANPRGRKGLVIQAYASTEGIDLPELVERSLATGVVSGIKVRVKEAGGVEAVAEDWLSAKAGSADSKAASSLFRLFGETEFKPLSEREKNDVCETFVRIGSSERAHFLFIDACSGVEAKD